MAASKKGKRKKIRNKRGTAPKKENKRKIKNKKRAAPKKENKKKIKNKKQETSSKESPGNVLKKILKEVVILIAGKQVEDIADLLDTKKHVNEFIIAKKLGLTINQTRNILYKISDHGLVSYIRKKDKKKGWYTYFWKIEVLKSLEFMKSDLLKKINQLENKIRSRETKRFYVCGRCGIEMAEENALACDFTCNECGDILALKDNTKLIREMKKSSEKLGRYLFLVNKEIQKEKEKIEKMREKEIKKEKLKKRRKRKKPIRKKKSPKKKKSAKKSLNKAKPGKKGRKKKGKKIKSPKNKKRKKSKR